MVRQSGWQHGEYETTGKSNVSLFAIPSEGNGNSTDVKHLKQVAFSLDFKKAENLFAGTRRRTRCIMRTSSLKQPSLKR